MVEPIKINTSQYKSEGHVDVDGHIWSIKLPGSGTEMRLSQLFRASKRNIARILILDKKIEDKTITLEELDKLEEYTSNFEKSEKLIFDFFSGVFNDGTEDNSEVKKWLEDTPMAIIEQSFNDIKKQADGEADGPEETPSGS